MIEKVANIQDNFLQQEEFINLRDVITSFEFPWHYSSSVVYEDTSGPGFFYHVIYGQDQPQSPFFNNLGYILNQLNIFVLIRVRINLNHRLPTPHYSDFHTDVKGEAVPWESGISHWTTSIFYIDTNNGYTELQDGTRIESVANRLVSFPLSTPHRFVSQTDEQTRHVINFGYLRKNVDDDEKRK